MISVSLTEPRLEGQAKVCTMIQEKIQEKREFGRKPQQQLMILYLYSAL